MESIEDHLNLPRIIWIYWHQGSENAPPLIQKCIHSWQHFHGNYSIRVLDNNSVKEYLQLETLIPKVRRMKMSIAAMSDVIRIHLLNNYGGIWVDATLMCLKPIDDWIGPFLSSSGFFAFDRPGSDRLVSSWFLTSQAQTHISQQWSQAVIKYWVQWKFRRRYYWFHYLFNSLYKSDAAFKDEWDATIKYSADGPHFFVPFRDRFFDESSEENIRRFESKDLPVVKLTYKCIKNGYPAGTMIDYLLNHRVLD